LVEVSPNIAVLKAAAGYQRMPRVDGEHRRTALPRAAAVSTVVEAFAELPAPHLRVAKRWKRLLRGRCGRGHYATHPAAVAVDDGLQVQSVGCGRVTSIS